MQPLKSPELSGMIDSSQVDEIFYQVPEILSHHEPFLEVLKQRITNWDTKQKIGDVFIEVFARKSLIETYTAFINNWKSAKEAIKTASHAKPAFAKFLENTSREHKGKLTLDALLIMPVQRIPRYELLIKELLKHTPADHPDYVLLLQAQKEVHELAININKVEREAMQQEQMASKMKELEHLIEGVVDLSEGDRAFVRHDFVMIPGGLGIRKDRCLFLFTDLLLITNIKRKSAAMRKPSVAVSTSPYGSLESNKYKLLMKIPLHNIDVIETEVDERTVKKFLKEIGHLELDVATLGKISEMIATLSCQHQILDDAVKEVLSSVSRQLVDNQAVNSQLMSLELAITVQDEVENLTVIFPNPEKRMTWESCFNEAKEKLALCALKFKPPEFLCPLPIRKTRAGLQITCASPSLDMDQGSCPEVWICNSDGYVGQICILTVSEEPTITSCYGVSNARIACITVVPGVNPSQYLLRRRSTLLPHIPGLKLAKWSSSEDDEQSKPPSFQLDSDTSDDEEYIDSGEEDPKMETFLREDDTDCRQPTIWLGTEDGCIYVYNCSDVKLKKAQNRLQHPSAICCIINVENKIFVSLANGEMVIYSRDSVGIWNTNNPQRVQAASTVAPISKMICIGGKLWCGTSNSIAVLNTSSLSVEHTFQITPDLTRPVLTMVSSGQGVWVAIQNSPVIRLFHALSYQELLDVNVAPPVTKMLSACDDIIRQHKSACLRVSALHVCKDLLWIGTSAGVILTLPIPHVSHTTSQVDTVPNVTGIPQGHTGHVRFITSVETPPASHDAGAQASSGDYSVRPKEKSKLAASPATLVTVISGGDGYEDFSHMTFSEAAGRDDSLNHLLLWRV